MQIKLLSKWGTMAAFVTAALVLSANVASMSDGGAAMGGADAQTGVVMDKPGDEARRIEVLERLHRGW